MRAPSCTAARRFGRGIDCGPAAGANQFYPASKVVHVDLLELMQIFYVLLRRALLGALATAFKAAVVLATAAGATRAAEQPDAIINQWLGIQTNVQTWASGFVQTRNLKALAQPLVSTGQVWFAAPQNFRWELGKNQTIAIRSNETMLVLYPRLKRAERYDFASAGPSEWKDALSLLQSGFPRSRAEIDHQFNILSLTATNGLYQLALQPRSLGARKMMPQINVFLTPGATLSGTELVFIDGSTMRNDFRDVKTNVPLEGKFDLSIPPDFKVVEPLKAGQK
jgi:outer membrane lipoprotein-sorting protein